MAKKGRPVVYESDDERPTTISVRVPHAMYARLERHVRLYRHSMTDLLLQGLAWRLEQDDPRSEVAILFNDENTVLQETLQQMIDARVQVALDAQREASAPPAAPSINGNTGIPPILEKAALVQRLKKLRNEGLSLQKIADQLNAEGTRTLSGSGRWQKGSVNHLLGAIKG